MYPEFVPIYVLLVVVLLLLIAVIVLAILILRKLSGHSLNVFPSRGASTSTGATHNGSVVFCRSCAKQFDSSMRFCPYCGTNR